MMIMMDEVGTYGVEWGDDSWTARGRGGIPRSPDPPVRWVLVSVPVSICPSWIDSDGRDGKEGAAAAIDW